jgi:trigger factor
MKVETQKVGPCRVKLIVNAEADETRPVYEDVVKVFMREGRVPGFRPGKAPREIILRDFQKNITEEVSNRLIRKYYKQALDDQKVELVSLLDVTDVIFTPAAGVSFSILADVRPTFELPKYTKIPLTFEDPVVTDDQVQAGIADMRKAFAKFKDAAPDYAAAQNDLVCIDFEGTVDGKPAVEVSAEAKPISSGKDFWMQIGGASFIAEVEEALKGLKAGESKEVKFKFAKDYPLEALRGKKAVYKVTVKKIRNSEMPTDEELLKQVKYSGKMEAFVEETKKNMQADAERHEKFRREQTITEALLKKTGEFDLPESELSDEINQTLDRMMTEAQYRGLTREDLEKNRTAIIENATKASKQQLRKRYLLNAIAKAEKMEVSEKEVSDEIAKIAAEYQEAPEKLRATVEKNGRMELLKMQIVCRKAMEFLLSEAKVK